MFPSEFIGDAEAGMLLRPASRQVCWRECKDRPSLARCRSVSGIFEHFFPGILREVSAPPKRDLIGTTIPIPPGCAAESSLAAFFTQADPQPPALAVNVLDLHAERGANPRKAVDHQADQRPVAQLPTSVVASILSISARASAGSSTGVLPLRTICSAHRSGGIYRHDLANHQPVKGGGRRRAVASRWAPTRAMPAPRSRPPRATI